MKKQFLKMQDSEPAFHGPKSISMVFIWTLMVVVFAGGCSDNDTTPECTDENALKFVDEGIHAYALANWDTDRDHCISHEEAAKVKTLDSYYSFYPTKTLDDLKQFPDLRIIESNAFWHCENLESVDLPQVTKIGDYAFENCSSLKSVNLPQVTEIGESAFQKCSNLTSVNLPNVTHIGSSAFENCDSLESIDLPLVERLEGYTFNSCSSLKSVNLPKATSIGYGDYGRTFADCTSLTSIELPKAEKIGDSVFDGCYKLKTINLPEAKKLGESVFTGTHLTTLALTTRDDIDYHDKGIFFSTFGRYDGSSCTLILHENKKNGGTSSPKVEEDGVTWAGVEWEKIEYVE